MKSNDFNFRNIKGGLNIFLFYKSFIYIAIISIAFCLIIGYVFVKKFKGHILQNWNKYKYNPIIIPFAHLLGKNPMEIFNGINFNIFKGFFKVLMAPFTYFLKIVYKKILPLIGNSLNKFREYTLPIRRFFRNGALMFYNKIDRYTKVVSFFFMKIRNIMKRLSATFRLLLYQLEASQLFIKSIWYGPIGSGSVKSAKLVSKASKFFTTVFPHVNDENRKKYGGGDECFHEDTVIFSKNKNKYVKIKEIKIGDIVQTDINEYSEVLGTCKFINPNNLYDLFGIKVSGSHIVKDGLFWKYVKDITNVKCKDQPEYVYSLITANNQLYIKDQIFRDHIEISCPNHHFNSVIKLINRNYSDFGNNTLIPGVSTNNFIKTQFSQCLIEDIKIGDKLYQGSEVKGIIRFKNKGETYKLKHLIATGRQIVYHNRQWISLQHHPEAKKINYNKEFITLLTSNNEMYMSGIPCLDFEEIDYPLDYLSYLNNLIMPSDL